LNLNNLKWNPAIENNKPVNASINIFIEITNDQLAAHVERVDMIAMNDNMKNPGEPVIYNKVYKYKNASLNSYEIKVWQKENSKLHNDMSTTSIVDKRYIVWYATYNGLTTYNGKDFIRITEKNSPLKATESVRTIAVDNKNNKWISGDDAVYKFDNTKWLKFDSTKIGIASAYNIISTKFDELFFCDDKGLLILKNGKWNLFNNKTIKQLPSNRVYYAYRDKSLRLWIGTFGGSIMIDKDNKIIDYNKSNFPLKGSCITAMTEDDNGNIYFALNVNLRKERDDFADGIAVLTKNGEWKHYNDSNSGLPSNTINSLLYDKFENVLWIGTNESGLVRFNLKDEWENYHNQNSQIPSSYIFNLSQDSKGNIYASTFNGMLRLRKK